MAARLAAAQIRPLVDAEDGLAPGLEVQAPPVVPRACPDVIQLVGELRPVETRQVDGVRIGPSGVPVTIEEVRIAVANGSAAQVLATEARLVLCPVALRHAEQLRARERVPSLHL